MLPSPPLVVRGGIVFCNEIDRIYLVIMNKK